MRESAILFGETGAYGIPLSDRKLATELTRAFLGYLGVQSDRESTEQGE